MKYIAIAVSLALGLVLAGGTTPAGAAEFRILDDHPEGCNIALTGQIAAGDTDRLRRLTASPDDPSQTRFLYGGITLCLDSPGGSYLEGLALAQHLAYAGIASHVPARATCLSACALAFLGGSRLGLEDGIIRTVDRSLHSTARLGFHAPQLDLPPGQFNETEVKKAFGVAIRSSALLFSRLDALKIDQAFALAFFDVPDGTFLEIDTPARVLALGADVTGITDLPTRIAPERAAQICAQVFETFDPQTYTDPDQYTSIVRTAHQDLPPQRAGQQRHAYLFATTAEGTMMWDACELTWTPPGAASGAQLRATHHALHDFNTYDYGNDTPPTQAELLARITRAPLRSALLDPALSAPAGTRLASLATAPPHLRSDKPAASCAPVHYSYRVVGVQNFSNLRAAPGFDAQVLAEVPKDARVTPLSHDFKATAIQTGPCRTACQPSQAGRLHPGDNWSIAACRGSNDVWWQVRTTTGTTGWMSSKYLRR